FVHVTSKDMLHWTWQKTKLQPSFTGHGMFSGTGFITKEGKPAAIYHGQASERNHIAIAKDNNLSAWEKPYSLEPKTADGQEAEMRHWDPDCFLIGDTYYAISGGRHQPLIKSDDLINWTYVGDFLSHELSDVAIGEDISCPNFFFLDGKWMLLCISHPLGCRYYIGDWDANNEQFVPETHGRMNWRRPDQSIYKTVYRDFFAPESVLTTDGRRVMWAWLASHNDKIYQRTIQSLPRELGLAEHNSLRIRPLRELESLRYDPVTLNDITVTPPEAPHSNTANEHIADLDGNAFEIKITIDREQANRKRFSIQLFANDDHEGLPIMIRPETGTLHIGTIDAPFAVADLPEGENLELRIFIDKYLVEVFANNRQSVVAAHMDYQSATGLNFYTYGNPTTIRQIEIWKMKATNQGFFEARENRVWEPDTE
ncbi:MAG: glycoside hydrolase family 32 protein, partial [Candidatus Latescibacteria bacterium]|nr:glycoside hydrolase family 32 protein [Candidatus Latescibacterota bacterium]